MNKKSIPVLCFVGASNSGKTTLVEKVIRVLAARGYKIATVKHTHKEVEIDEEGKDSWRHRAAGAKTVILSTPSRFALVSERERELTIDEALERYVGDMDILIVEGFKRDRYPKIEVYRRGVSGEHRCLTDSSVIALATDEVLEIPGTPYSIPGIEYGVPGISRTIPRFDLNDAEGISGFIEGKFLKGEFYD